MDFPTAQTVVAQAGVELGLFAASDLGDNVYESSDPLVLQMLALLKKTGRDLVDEYEWQQLRAEWSLQTVTGTLGGAVAQRIGAYVMPPDWRGMIAQSGWNRTTRLPMGGPLSEQEWQYLSSRLTGVVWTVLFRPMQGLLWLYPPTGTPTGQAITFGYRSANWVRPASLVEGTDYGTWLEDADFDRPGLIVAGASAGNPFTRNLYRLVQPGHTGIAGPDPQLSTTGVPTISGPIKDNTGGTDAQSAWWNWIGTVVESVDPTGVNTISTPSFATKTEPSRGTDVLLFDEQLLVARLKLAWRESKGFDTAGVQAEATRQFDKATANNTSAPILSLAGTGLAQDRLLGELNVPITGFGS